MRENHAFGVKITHPMVHGIQNGLKIALAWVLLITVRRPEDSMRLARKNQRLALTIVEFLCLVACLLIFAALLLPALARPKGNTYRTRCVNNLRQIGLCFQTWALDNSNRFPMQVSTTNGGTMELVNSGVVFPHFMVMSNELSTPKLLVCPAETDPTVIIAGTFDQDVRHNPANTILFTNDNNVTYFAGVDANPLQPGAFLAGDRNLKVDGAMATHGLHSFATNTRLDWPKLMHNGGGNICLADGSVQQANTRALRSLQLQTGLQTNRLAIP